MVVKNYKWIALGALVTGCAVETPPEVHQQTQVKGLGESSQAYWFSGPGAGEMPTREERIAAHLMNRVRMSPYVWGIQDEDGNPIPPAPPLVYQPFFAEAGRWQGAHAIQYSCYCPQDPMAEPAAWNSCCELGYDDGQVKCVGPIVGCGDEGSTEQDQRWALLNRGPGQISQEIYWNGELEDPIKIPGEIAGAWVVENMLSLILSARDNAFGVSQVNEPIVPEECLPQDDPCEVGACTDLNSGANSCDTATNPDCLGVCQGAGVGDPAPPCVLPAPIDTEACKPENYGQAFYWSFATGRGSDPIPELTDGIAMGLGLTATEQSPNGLFGVTPDGEIEFTVHYFERSGDPRDIKAVVRSSCVDLEPWVLPPAPEPVDADAGETADDSYAGITFRATVADLPTGCQRYFFTATDAEGFIHRYPTHGSLGVSVDGAGNAVLEDPNCPVWAPEVPAATCLPAGDECNEGDTRPCYAGRDGTQGKGICTTGLETCGNGRWSGLCADEVRPELAETCGDDLDNNCNGLTDEDCPVVVEPTPEPDAGTGEDTGTTEDVGPAPTDKTEEDEGCGCATVQTDEKRNPMLWLAGLLGLVAFIRRRS